MKLKSIKKKIWSIVIIITTLIGILPVQANTTETPVKDVELDGRWDDPIRSAATNCPIKLYLPMAISLPSRTRHPTVI